MLNKVIKYFLENAAITQLRRRLRARHSNFRLQPKSLEL